MEWQSGHEFNCLRLAVCLLPHLHPRAKSFVSSSYSLQEPVVVLDLPRRHLDGTSERCEILDPLSQTLTLQVRNGPLRAVKCTNHTLDVEWVFVCTLSTSLTVVPLFFAESFTIISWHAHNTRMKFPTTLVSVVVISVTLIVTLADAGTDNHRYKKGEPVALWVNKVRTIFLMHERIKPELSILYIHTLTFQNIFLSS